MKRRIFLAESLALFASACAAEENVAPAVPPRITLTPNALSFAAVSGTQNPAAQSVGITNGGEGSLGELTIGAVSYGSVAGWLQLTLNSTTGSSTLSIQPVIGSLSPGTYSAVVPISAAGASNSPQSVNVSLVLEAAPRIGLAPSSVLIQAMQGGANPSSQSVAISNAGGGELRGLSLGPISFGASASGWLQAALSGSTAPATLTLQPTAATPGRGTHTASVPVTAPVASNSPQNVTVSLTVIALPQIRLSPPNLSFSAVEGGANPAAQTVGITNAGDGVLEGLTVESVTYGAGASGWLRSPTLDRTTAASSVMVQPTTGGLAPGAYTATVLVASTSAANSPQPLSVMLTVAPNILFNDDFGTLGARLDLAKWTTDQGAGTFYGRTQEADWERGPGVFIVGPNGAELAVNTFNPTNDPRFDPSLYGTHARTRALFQPSGGGAVVYTARVQLTDTALRQRGLVFGIYLFALLPNGKHDEIDIELVTNRLGGPLQVQLNRYAAEDFGAGHPRFVSLPAGFVATDPHDWSIRWSASRIEYFVDGQLLGTDTSIIPQGAMCAHVNAWGPDPGWSEAYDASLRVANAPSQNQRFVAYVKRVEIRLIP
jgi:hypothetical protein